MELQQLRYFVALSQELHFQRAAQKTHVSQPTLSQQIKKLEDELGTPLFERSPQRVKLTEAGKKFLPYASNVLEDLEKGTREVQESSDELSGVIRVGAIPTMGPYLLPEAIIKLRKEAPKLALELFEETTPVLLQSLKEGRLDLGILSLPITESGIIHKVIGEENFYLAVSKHHKFSGRKTVNIKDLDKERLLILQEGHCFGNQALEYCKRSREDSQIIFQGSSLTSVLRLAETGDGVTFVPEMAARTSSYPKLIFLPFSSPKPKREIVVAWRVTTPLRNIHRFLLDILEKSL